MHLWSERPGPRIRQIAADVATLTWVAFWISIGVSLYGFLAQLAGAGRFISDSGTRLRGIGAQLGGALQGIPLVGEGAANDVRAGFSAAADPMIQFGGDLERLLIIVAALLGLLLAAVAVVPWLNRYLPWRVAAWRRLNAGARVIRRRRFARSVPIAAVEVERILASRALHRLEYDELLEFTPDPFGDWVAGRHERLARAELDRVGLQAIAAPR
ncbi:MAG TPA: hypothetical protein VEW45_09100 [Candidatus Dormibacteraeota bacterium]|nr:hypothetical protein [Candidatus Dormibacteraeota bacterium]